MVSLMVLYASQGQGRLVTEGQAGDKSGSNGKRHGGVRGAVTGKELVLNPFCVQFPRFASANNVGLCNLFLI